MDKMAFLCAASQFRSEPVNIEGFGTVNIKKFTVGDVATLDSRPKEIGEKYPGAQLAFWLLIGVCDDNGDLMFTEDNMNELTALPVSIVSKLVDAVFKVNGLNAAASNAIEEAEKN